MNEIALLGYAKVDSKGNKYYFVRSSEEDQVVNLKDFVIFVHPFQTAEQKDKVRIILRPGNKKQ